MGKKRKRVVKVALPEEEPENDAILKMGVDDLKWQQDGLNRVKERIEKYEKRILKPNVYLEIPVIY